MNEDDIALRNLACLRFAELGRAPAAAEIAAVAGLDDAEVMTGWERLPCGQVKPAHHPRPGGGAPHGQKARDPRLGKLGAANRTESADRARQLGLIS